MSTQPNAAEIMIGAGKLYFDRFDANGISTGMRFVGNASKFEITGSVDKADVWDYTKSTRTKLTTITKTQTHTVAIDLGEFSAENISLALLGTSTAFTQTGGTITAEVLASTASASSTVPSMASIQANTILQTAQRNISSVALSAYVGSTPTLLTAGTDYEVEDANEGTIRILSIANFPVSADSLKIGYTAGAVTSTAAKKIIAGGASPQIYGRLKFVGDPVAGKARTVDAWRVHIEPSSALALISDDPGAISLTGEILNDATNHPTYPLYQIVTR